MACPRAALMNWRRRWVCSEPPRVYWRVKHSKDEPYDKAEIHPRLCGRTICRNGGGWHETASCCYLRLPMILDLRR